MKKARIMLVAIAVLGMIGGTLAFRAQKYFTASKYYVSTVAGKTYCFPGVTIVPLAGAPTTTLAYTTTTAIAADGAYTIFNSNPVKYCASTTTLAYFSLAE